MNTSEFPVWLAVPHEERERARKASGRLQNGQHGIGWDKEAKLWFARPGADLDRVAEWLPDPTRKAGGGDPEAEFLDALTAEGLVLNGMPIMDGKRHRVSTVEDKKGKQSGVYCGFLDRRPGGWFINYHRAPNDKEVTNWSAKGGEGDPITSLHIRAGARQAGENAVRERNAKYEERTKAAKSLYDRLPSADVDHPYLIRKGITPTSDIRQTRNGALVVPFYNTEGEFKTLQYIPPDGGKYLFEDAPKQGNYLVVGGEISPGATVLYAEGYATARSLNLATGLPVVMTIDAGNMVAVAKSLQEKFPTNTHVLMADFDHAKDQNKGLIQATAAAELIGGKVIYPEFTADEITQGFTDFNDIHQSRGLEGLRNLVIPALGSFNEVSAMQNDQPSNQSDDAPAGPTPLAFTHNGIPAELGLQREGSASIDDWTPAIDDAPPFDNVPPVDDEAFSTSVARYPVEEPVNPALEAREPVASQAPEPLSFTHNGQPATLGLENYGAASQQTDVAPTVPVSATAEPMPTPGVKEELAQRAQAGPGVPPFDDLVRDYLGSSPVAISTAEAREDSTGLADPQSLESSAVGGNEDVAPPRLEIDPKPLSQPASESYVTSEDSYTVEQPISVAPQVAEVEEPEISSPPPVAPNADKASPDASVDPVIDSIQVGPPRPNGDDEVQVSQLDKDALLTRLTWEKIDDKSMLYKLDNEPAFIDRGSRLDMAEGASQNDEKVIAALLTAAQYYRGRIELTGSDAFKAKAIGLIAKHQINVGMKNPVQQAMLEDARKALSAPQSEQDAIKGDLTPEPGGSGPSPTESAIPRAAQSAYEPLVAGGPAQLTGAGHPAATAQMQPVVAQASQPGYEPVAISQEPAQPRQLEADAAAADDRGTGISPAIHQSHTAAKDGVTGKVMDFGTAPFRFEDGNTESTFIKLRTKSGLQTFWGKELAGLLRETRAQRGSMMNLRWLGKEQVVVQAPVRNEHNVVVRYEAKEAYRNQWSMTPVGGTSVRTGGDEGVKLSAYDYGRFVSVQQQLLTQLRMDFPLPTAPSDGLFWLTPNGHGSFKTGDALSAKRPPQDNNSKGQRVISSWSDDGHLDMALVRGDGNYLQGVVRQGEHYHHVLVSLPGKENEPPMVFNSVTPGGLVAIGVGNGINRSSGEPVVRENIAFKLEGDGAVRIGKLDHPADLPPALHARLGFDERWKDDHTLPKSAPAVAPSVQPSEYRPS